MLSLLPLVLASLALAGCAADPEPPTAGTPTPLPPTGAPAPFEPVRLTHDHTGGTSEEATFTIPPGAGPLEMQAYHTELREGAPCAAVDARIVVLDPDGQTVAERTSMGSSMGTERCGGAATATVEKAGEYVVRFSGRGAVLGVVEVGPPPA